MLSDHGPVLFLCYAKEDQERVKSLYHSLKFSGFQPWMDICSIHPGEKWDPAIFRAIRRSDFFLICLTSQSVSKRGFSQREITEALKIAAEKLEDDIYLIPVRLEECKMPERLAEFHYIDIFEDDDLREESGFEKLSNAIEEGMRRRQLPRVIQTPQGSIQIKSELFSESKVEYPRYSIEIHYSEFCGLDSKDETELNERIRGFVLEQVHESRRYYYYGMPDDFGELRPQLSSDVSIASHLLYASGEIISLRFDRSTYSLGAAHSNEDSITFNFRLGPVATIGLSDIFLPDTSYLERIADYCIEDLRRQWGWDNEEYDREEDSKEAIPSERASGFLSMDQMINQWIRKGAGPDEKNFVAFNITKGGLLFNFRPYQVGSYAWGTRHVLVPYSILADIVNPNGPLVSLLNL